MTGDRSYLDGGFKLKFPSCWPPHVEPRGAISLFNTVAGYWDDEQAKQSCGGGVWWDTKRTYKNAVTNQLCLLTAVKLAEVTPNGDADTYWNWAKKEADWFLSSGMITSQGLIVDGLSKDGNCTPTGDIWTYNQGPILVGLAELGAHTGDTRYSQAAAQIAQAVMDTKSPLLHNGVLTDSLPGDAKENDQAFKGILADYLNQYAQAQSDPAITATIAAFLNTNLAGLKSNARSGTAPNYQYSDVWDNSGSPSETNSASNAAALGLQAATLRTSGSATSQDAPAE